MTVREFWQTNHLPCLDFEEAWLNQPPFLRR
jgi:hypothetical protein